MTPSIASLSHGSICPCGIGTVTGVDCESGKIYAVHTSTAWGVTMAATHAHSFAQVEQLLRAKVHAGADRARWPHECVRCGAPAFVGAVPAALDCYGGCR